MPRTQSAAAYLLEDEMKLKEEKAEAQEEEKDEKDEMSLQMRARIRVLEGDLERARDSERKMLESLMSQTKQLEKVKIELEEAKLELRTLRQDVDTRQKKSIPLGSDTTITTTSGGSKANPKRMERSHSLIDHARAQQEILCLKNELRLTTEAEEKSRRAMDDLALALKQVATEAHQAKEELAATRAEFLAARAEADHTMRMLKASDEALREALLENERLKAEGEDLAATWQAKEEGFRDCVRLFEEEIHRARLDNDDLREMQRGSRGEISKLRDIMKQAVNEANVVKEAMEIARAENSQLKDALAEKEHVLQRLKQELDSLKVSEAAAVSSVEELKCLLAATSTSTSTSTTTSEDHVNGKSLEEKSRTTVLLKEEDGGSLTGGSNPNPTGGSVLMECPSPPPPVVHHQRPHRRFASMGSLSLPRLPSSSTAERGDDYYDGDDTFDGGGHVDDMQSAWGSPLLVPKKRPMIRKFGDMLRRSFRK